MHFSVLVAGLAIGQAAATGWRLDAQKYSSPYNTNNECSTDQKTGYNWDNLNPGSFSSYGSNKFTEFKCGNSFGKRDGITKRSFQDKCITAEIHKEPKIECDGKDKMTIDSYQVSSSWDTDVEAHHQMPDGSVCKQTHRCTHGGNVVKNTQCAGSQSVTFKPKKGENGRNEAGDACSIGIHSIGFKCEDNRPSSTQPAYSASTTSSVSQHTSDVETTSVPTSSHESSSEIETTFSHESSSIEVPTTSSEIETASSHASSSIEVPTTSSTESSPETTGVPIPNVSTYSSYANVSSTAPTESSKTVPTSYVPTETSTTETSSTPKSTTIVDSSSDVISSTEVSPGSTGPAYQPSSVVPTNSSAPVNTATTSSDVEVPTQTYATPDTPDLLPQCVNTWIGQTKCKDNADSTCYCRDAEFVKQVMGCIEAWSEDDDKTQGAASYFQGICAPYINEVPAIITACPSVGKPTTTPVSETSTVETPAETASIPATSSSESSPETTSSSSAAESTPETTTSVKPSTITYYSTSAVTITSCAADITNCPASSTVVSEVPVSYTVVETPAATSPASPEQVSSSTFLTSAVDTTCTSSLPATTTPAPAPAGPSTVITYSSSIQVPATYTTGESYGEEIPGSSTYATIDTTITVPQVQFVTSTITVPGSTGTISVGLAAGTPPVASAYTTPAPTADAAGASSTTATTPSGSSGFGTNYISANPTGSITPYTGGAAFATVRFASMVVCAVAAFFVM